MPQALFVCYGGGHAKMVIPVVRELTAARGWSATVLALTLAGPQMRAAGIPSVGYRDLLRPEDERAVAYGKRLLGDSHDPASGIAVEESVAYLGLSFQDLVDRLGEAAATERYKAHGRHAFLQLGPMARAIERWRPDVVVTTNSPKSERAALVVASERGVPTVGIEDLLGIRQNVIRPFVPPFRATRLCVGSRIAIDNLVRDESVDPASCRLTGNPSFDRLAMVGDRRRSARRRLSLDDRTPLVVVYTQSGPDPDLLVSLSGALSSMEHVRVAVRRHPNHRAMPAARLVELLPPSVALVDDVDLDDLLAASDVAMAVSTTVLVEAILAGNLVVQLGPALTLSRSGPEGVNDLPLFEHGAAILMDDLEQLRRLIERVVPGASDETRARARDLFVRPGSAARAIADQIREVATG